MSKTSRNFSIKLAKRELLFAIVFASYIGSIVCNFYLLKEIDRNYSELIDHSVPVLRELNNVTASAAYAIHQTYPRLFDEKAPGRIEALQRARAALTDETLTRIRFLQSDFSGISLGEMTELKEVGEEFSRIGNNVVKLYAEENLKEAELYRERELRPALERYIAATKMMADKISDIGEKSSDQITEKTRRMSLSVLGFASWPAIALLLIFIVLLSLGLVVLFIMFKATWDIKNVEKKTPGSWNH